MDRQHDQSYGHRSKLLLTALSVAWIGMILTPVALRAQTGDAGVSSASTAQVTAPRLPKHSMQPRLYDPRVTFLTTGKYIKRWWLEKKDPAASISDVVQPIVFRLTPNVPAQAVSYVKEGIERWNPLFEAIGFRHAIVVRLAADTPTTDREVVVDWDTTDNGATGGITTPRFNPETGELIGGTIMINERFVEREGRNILLRGELDPHTPMPLPDSMKPIILDDVILHEAGHALGLDHNFKGSGVYPTDSLRSPSFLRRMGQSASVMAYAAGNYVAQPEDGVTFMDRRARIGPYDWWAIAWGYRPIPEAATPEAEQPTLERWRAMQDTTPYLQSSLEHPGTDPTDQPFTAGNDPVKASEYGLRNLVYLTAALDPKRDTVVETHPKPYYIAKSWNYRMTIAASVIGGVMPQPPYPADLAKLHVLPVDSAQQVRAMKFVLAHALYGQDDLITKYVLSTTSPRPSASLVLFDSVAYGWYADQWRENQQALLTQLVGALGDQLLSQQVGLHAALCQEMAPLKERLSAAASNSEYAKQLYDIVVPVFDTGGACH